MQTTRTAQTHATPSSKQAHRPAACEAWAPAAGLPAPAATGVLPSASVWLEVTAGLAPEAAAAAGAAVQLALHPQEGAAHEVLLIGGGAGDGPRSSGSGSGSTTRLRLHGEAQGSLRVLGAAENGHVGVQVDCPSGLRLKVVGQPPVTGRRVFLPLPAAAFVEDAAGVGAAPWVLLEAPALGVQAQLLLAPLVPPPTEARGDRELPEWLWRLPLQLQLGRGTAEDGGPPPLLLVPPLHAAAGAAASGSPPAHADAAADAVAAAAGPRLWDWLRALSAAPGAAALHAVWLDASRHPLARARAVVGPRGTGGPPPPDSLLAARAREAAAALLPAVQHTRAAVAARAVRVVLWVELAVDAP